MMAAQESAASSRDRLDDSSAAAMMMSPPASAPVSKMAGPSKIAGSVPPKRAGHDKHAELFRKDLISAMKLPDTEVLQSEEYVLIADSWKLEWERGVQVPVDPENIPPIVVKCVAPRPAPLSDYTVAAVTDADEDFNVFRLPRKFLYSCTDDNFEPLVHELYFTSQQTDDVCRYDLDEVDSAWLAEFNELRETTGEEPVSEELMERVMEQLEMLCHANLQQAIRTVDGLGIEYDENVVCDVCRSPDGEDSNEMVFCDACDICVHQACYGITNIPEGNWLCRTCALNIQPTCVLCPKTGGAMKSTKSGTKWAHISCALWIPEVTIDCPDKMEPITNISQIPSSRWALVCSLCRERAGACIQCCVKACKTSFHVTCAFQHGLDLKTTFSDDGTDVQLKAYCSKHSVGREDKQSVANGNIAAAAGLLNELEHSMTDEERTELRSHRLKKLAEEFYEHVEPVDVAEMLDLDSETVDFIYSYWVLKRKTGFDRPLLMPKTEEVDILTKQREDTLIARMKMFIHLRQELERVRNLCYMVNKREKTRSLLYQLKEDIFRREALLADLEDEETESGGGTCGVPQHLHRSTRTFYDEPLAILSAADRDVERGELIDRQMSNTASRVTGPTAANFIPSATDAALVKAASRRARPSSRDVTAAAASHGSQIQQLFRDKMDIREARGWIPDEIKTDSSDGFIDSFKLASDLSDVVTDSNMTEEMTVDNNKPRRLVDFHTKSNANGVSKPEPMPSSAGKRNSDLEIPEITKSPSITASSRNSRNMAAKRSKSLRVLPANKLKNDTVDVNNSHTADLTSALPEEKTGMGDGSGKVKVNDSRKSFPGRSPLPDHNSSPSKLSKLKRKSMTAGFLPGKLTKMTDAVNCEGGKRRRSGVMSAGKQELLDIIAKFEEMDSENLAEGSAEINTTSEEIIKSDEPLISMTCNANELPKSEEIVSQDGSQAVESISSEQSLSKTDKELELTIENVEKPSDPILLSSPAVSHTQQNSVDSSCSPNADKNLSSATPSSVGGDKIAANGDGGKRTVKTRSSTPSKPENVEAVVENTGKETAKVVGRQRRNSTSILIDGKGKDLGDTGEGKSSRVSEPGKEIEGSRRLRPVRTKPKDSLDSSVHQDESHAKVSDEKRLRNRKKSGDSATSLVNIAATRKSVGGCAASIPGLPCGKDEQISRSRRSVRVRNRIPSDSSADLDSRSVCSVDVENVPLKSETNAKVRRKRLRSVDSESNKSSSEKDENIIAAEETLTVDSAGTVTAEKFTEAEKRFTAVGRKMRTSGRASVEERSKVTPASNRSGVAAGKVADGTANSPDDMTVQTSTDNVITRQPVYTRPPLAGFSPASVGLRTKLGSRVLPATVEGSSGRMEDESRTSGLQSGSNEAGRLAGGNNDKVTSFLASLYSKLNRKPAGVVTDGNALLTPSPQLNSETTETAVTNSRKRTAHLMAGCRSRTVGVKKPVAEVEENDGALSADLEKSACGEAPLSSLDNSLAENSRKKSIDSPLRVETVSNTPPVVSYLHEEETFEKSMPVLDNLAGNPDTDVHNLSSMELEHQKLSLFPPVDSTEPPPSPTPSIPLARFDYLNGIDRVNTLFPSPTDDIKTSASISRREGLREKLLRRFLPSQLVVPETIKSRVRNSLGLIASACTLNGPSTICHHTQQKIADCLSWSRRGLADRRRKSPTSFRHPSTDDPNDAGLVATRLLPVRQRRRKAYSEWDYVTGEDLTSPTSPAGSDAASSDSDFTVEKIEPQPSDDDFSPRCHAFRGRIRRLSLPR